MDIKQWPPTESAKRRLLNGVTRLLVIRLMKRGEVWWVEFDPSAGSEIRKTRPAVIVSNDAANRNLGRVVVIPITSNTGRIYPGEAEVTIGGQNCKSMADQIMAADKSRLKTRADTLSKADMRKIDDAIKVHLALER
jgi:mRNA interferase MazF